MLMTPSVEMNSKICSSKRTLSAMTAYNRYGAKLRRADVSHTMSMVSYASAVVSSCSPKTRPHSALFSSCAVLCNDWRVMLHSYAGITGFLDHLWDIVSQAVPLTLWRKAGSWNGNSSEIQLQETRSLEAKQAEQNAI